MITYYNNYQVGSATCLAYLYYGLSMAIIHVQYFKKLIQTEKYNIYKLCNSSFFQQITGQLKWMRFWNRIYILQHSYSFTIYGHKWDLCLNVVQPMQQLIHHFNDTTTIY